MRIQLSSLVVATALTLAATPALAQPDARTTVSIAGGFNSGSSDTGVALGGAVLFDLTERVSFDGHATYLGRGAGADAVAAGGSLLVNLRPSTEPVVPYVALGGDVFHASYDLANARFLGPAGMQFAPGTTLCPAPGTGFGHGHGPGLGTGSETCPGSSEGYWGVGALHPFYANRLGPLAFPAVGGWETRSFTDPALSLGGGVRLNLTEHLMLRPDLRALVIFAHGDTHTLGVFVLNLGYRF